MTFTELFNLLIDDYSLDGNEIARNMNLSQEYYSSIVNNERDMDLYVFKEFCDTINVSVSFAFKYGISRKNENLSTIKAIYE